MPRKLIIGLHGLSNKPREEVLKEWWWKSITDGVHFHRGGLAAPTTEERDNCTSWFDAELDLLDPAVFVALGDYAYRSVWRYLADRGWSMPRPRPAFAHGREVKISDGLVVIASYHPSQQNTFTGKLTEDMLDAVFSRASELAQEAPP